MKKMYAAMILILLVALFNGCQMPSPPPVTGDASPGAKSEVSPADSSLTSPAEGNREDLQEAKALKEETIKLMNAGKFDEALKTINKAIEIDPRDDLLSKRADIYVSTDRYKEAVEDLKAALKVSERNDRKALIYGQLADVYNELGEDDKSLEAIREFEKVEKELPEDAFRELPIVYGTMGIILADNEEYDRAIKCLDKAIEKEPGQTQLLFERGYAYYQSGNNEKAKADINKWLKSAHSSRKVNNLRSTAISYMILGEYEQGLKFINEVISKEPDDFSYYNDRAYIYILKGDKESATKDLEIVLKKYPDEKSWERRMAKKLKKKII